jgi:predicted metal-dependent enzyme (double-stranded beta helix superfamily)
MADSPLLVFVRELSRLQQSRLDQASLLEQGLPLLAQLVARDDWLPEPFTRPHPQFYQQYLLYGDPLERLSVVSFVWAPGQRTPVHDHLTWGMVGCLRGSERETPYQTSADGQLLAGASRVLLPGDVVSLSPASGDVHAVENALADQVSISIHVYGANIGRVQRHVFDPASGVTSPFVSGYASSLVPNLWSA